MMKWQLTANGALRLRCWDNECIAYHSLSGDTHLMGPAAACLLERLQQAPADEASLALTVSRALRMEPTEELKLQLRDMLADLKKLALIEEAA